MDGSTIGQWQKRPNARNAQEERHFQEFALPFREETRDGEDRSRNVRYGDFVRRDRGRGFLLALSYGFLFLLKANWIFFQKGNEHCLVDLLAYCVFCHKGNLNANLSNKIAQKRVTE